MPTYEYRCKDCRHELEAQQSFSDDPLTECPSCGGLLKKKFSSVGISFKGSGFYKTDSRTSSSSKSKGEGSGSSESKSSSDTATASKDSSSGSSDSGSSSTTSSGTSGSSSTPATKSPAATPA
jgi:putative FmdB family regulatory protein